MSLEIATLGGGCFWCVEAVYNQLIGVESALSGYMGGHVDNPTYEQVCAKTTGHAEVVNVTFDNDVISFEDILNIFFATHDPTTLNRQGNDVGPQYRSGIWYHSEEQKRVAEATISRIENEGLYRGGIVTEISPASTFWVAEDYHQDYFVNNPRAGYCAYVIAPKVAKFRKTFFERLKK
ncbi:MAG: peptide-methionine (S)-S-oxide reductase MsrA [Chloroflexota bacterium]|nr:peptide-methionine (S)-S-oxide reductase MsrA [Chloroflexota bacterium]MDE2907692.1 peptide-methionine (S)-S-oxide reductase MsrA [Chloroflexota bacterium]